MNYPTPLQVIIWVPILTILGGLIIMTIGYMLDELKKGKK